MKFFKKKKRSKIAKNTFECSKEWDDLKGDNEVRFCDSCENNVYNLTELTEEEAVKFIESHEGKVCTYAHYDRSGVIVNGECSDERQVIRMLGTATTIDPEELFGYEPYLDHKIESAKKRVQQLQALKRKLKNKQS